ncbi:aminotransferase class I/II-fold pyridoxal phosphate-dependent enzyme [Lactobacillus sp. Sy-1]|uniref:aminotransferase class I/II-fold pyridoxal phosphate-dependent enzyme n=1 Tax=Lactobacillus sp. Sy-1 TaxID=2109645 RepID=UPI001C5AD36A|nr:aminotransferase class I/II-fold pyridoxal phosphate-dependent enzyme [Lactobacillus sp. Sy-1]MBW1606166.1 aminotransferase class I/II-fold pyridoxal phosphate-dependent enzyme [Lactobacillus sp. Sy-1]
MDLSKIISSKIMNIEPEGISTFSSEIANIPDLIKLTVGEPDLKTPQHIKDAAINAINGDQTHYTDPVGSIEVRNAAANFVNKKYGLNYDPKTEVVNTIGVSEAILDVYLALLNPRDEILIPAPAFPVYAGAVQVAGGKVVFIDTSNDGFKLTANRLADTLKEHPHAKGLILTCPNNPTGTVYSESELKAIAEVIKKYDTIVISDEIYSEITYGGQHHSFANYLRNQTIVFNGLSKSHAMTGWRFGVIFAPAPIMKELKKVHVFNTYNVSSFIQAAAIEAFTNGINDAVEMRDIYQKRRDIVINGLAEAGIHVVNPGGAFYIFAKVPENYPGNSVDFCLALAKQAHVGVVPGSAFGPGGEGFFRISYAASTENLSESMKRIKSFLTVKEP